MRLIDADALVEKFDYEGWIESAIAVEGEPTIDAVPVVRCEECRWCHAGFCELHDDIIPWGAAHTRWRDWFCADGQRREDGEA